MPKVFKILSIDGGGILGLYSADILAKIQDEFCHGAPLSQYFNLITGTSTGGIIALGLSIGKNASEIVSFYKHCGAEIFPKRKRRFWGILKNKYSNKKLKSALEDCLGNKTISDCQTALCIPAIDAALGQPIVFKTNNNGNQLRDENTRLVDIALATSAAPTYFPMHHFDNFTGLVDGGLWQNNPALCGVIEAASYFMGSGKKFEKIDILSIGNPISGMRTGLNTRSKKSGALQWNLKLVFLPMKISSIGVHQIVRFLSKNHALGINKYLRIESNNIPPQYSRLKLDSADEMSYMQMLELSRHDFDNHKTDLADFFKEDEQ